MGIIGKLFKKEVAAPRTDDTLVVKKKSTGILRTLRDNPSSTYDSDSGVMQWGSAVVNPGDYIRVKHNTGDGYNTWVADEAGMFLGVVDDFLCFQTGVKRQKAQLLEISSVEVMSRMDENTEK